MKNGSALIVFAMLFFGCQNNSTTEKELSNEELKNIEKTVIAFGSCGSQDRPMPVLGLAADYNPDAFVFLGDNIYGDTKVMDTLRAKYARLEAKTPFQKLKNTSIIEATWDDHDYGWNDIGRHYPFKEESKEIFLDFWEVPKDDERRARKGIYGTRYFSKEGKGTIQLILLDTRTFRDDLRRYDGFPKVDTVEYHYHLDYSPYETADSTLLGTEQWTWLEIELKKEADVRIIASSTQFGISWNGYEAWANFPHEQQRMLDLIKKTEANGVVFISGDVHYAEISKIEEEGLYPIYDVTSSGITSTWHFATPNTNRINGPIMENHFGMIEVYWADENPILNMKVVDVSNELRFERKVPLSEISF